MTSCNQDRDRQDPAAQSIEPFNSLSPNGSPSWRRVVLVRVPEDFSVGVQEVFVRYESLGLGYVAAVLRQHGHEVTILDGTLLEVTSDLKERLNPRFKKLLADLYLEAISGAKEGQLNSTELVWLVQKTYLAQQVLEEEPDLVGFSLISSLVYGRVTEMVGLLRDVGLKAPICAGGEQAALYADDVLAHIPGLDACIKGEGEYTCLELAEHADDRGRWGEIQGLVWRNGDRTIRNPDRLLLHDLDELPFPARDHLPEILTRGGETVISGSRGCWAKCSFCSIIEFYDPKLGERWRGRSPENIVREIQCLYETYGADRFWFVDDEFFKNGEAGRLRAEEIFRCLSEAHLPIRFDIFARAGDFAHFGPVGTLEYGAFAGLRRALIGIEAGSLEVLKKLYHKGTTPDINRRAIEQGEMHGIDVVVEFIMFNPWTTLEHVMDNLALLKSAPRGPKNRETAEQRYGKYDPMTLSSKLYIHRQTPLGHEFVENWDSLRDSDVTVGDDFYIAYRFECPRVRALTYILDNTWDPFSSVIQAQEQLYRLVDRFWLPQDNRHPRAAEIRALGAYYAEQHDQLKMLLNDEALAFFEEALEFVKKAVLDPEDSDAESQHSEETFVNEVDTWVRRVSFQTENVATYAYSLTVPMLAEVWEVLEQYNLRGRQTRPPSILIREYGESPPPSLGS